MTSKPLLFFGTDPRHLGPKSNDSRNSESLVSVTDGKVRIGVGRKDRKRTLRTSECTTKTEVACGFSKL